MSVRGFPGYLFRPRCIAIQSTFVRARLPAVVCADSGLGLASSEPALVGCFASSGGRASLECALAGGVSAWGLGLQSAAVVHAANKNKTSKLRKITPLSTPVFREFLAPEQNL